MPPIGQATRELQPVYSQAGQALQAQTPAIQSLYQALIQGLQTQAGAQTQNVVNSAEMRGVGRAGLAGDVQAQLGQELALQTGQLTRQQVQDASANQQAIGRLGVNRGTRIADLARSLQETNLDKKKAQIDAQQANRAAQLDIQQAERDFQVRQAANARQKAEQAARATAKEESLTTGQALLTIGDIWQPGRDGYVNPRQWNELRRAFIEAGYSGSSFDDEFGSLVNPEHQYRDSKLPRYKGIALRD